MASAATPAMAQETTVQGTTRNTLPQGLPRPGYDRQPIIVGPANITLDADLSATYNSNVYASTHNPRDDVNFSFRPHALVSISKPNLNVAADLHADLRRFVDLTRENSNAYGASLAGNAQLGRQHKLTASARFDRVIESRADPETRAGVLDRPRRINVAGGDLGYTLDGSRLRIAISGGIDNYNYLDRGEDDRDQTIYRGSMRTTWRPTAPIGLFVEVYGAHRDYRLFRDFSGVHRDATTYGAVAGLTSELGGRLSGSMGIGVFRLEPDDPTLPSRTGFAVNGKLIWQPRARTAVTLEAFRGDVATVRAGATDRTDTRVGVSIEQEARHNLILTGHVNWLQTEFHGGAPAGQNTVTVGVGAEFLLNRRFSLFTRADYRDRTADRALDAFSQSKVEVGLRLRF